MLAREHGAALPDRKACARYSRAVPNRYELAVGVIVAIGILAMVIAMRGDAPALDAPMNVLHVMRESAVRRLVVILSRYSA